MIMIRFQVKHKVSVPSFQTHYLVKSTDFMSMMNFNVYDLSRPKEGHLSSLFTIQGLTLGWWPYITQFVFIKRTWFEVIAVVCVCCQLSSGQVQSHLQKLGTGTHTALRICTWLLILPANELEGRGPTPSMHCAATAVQGRHFGCGSVLEV